MEAMTLWPIFAGEARLRMLSGLKQFKDKLPFGPRGPSGRTRDLVAQFLGISGRTMERLKYIYDHEDEYPDQVRMLAGTLASRDARGRTSELETR